VLGVLLVGSGWVMIRRLRSTSAPSGPATGGLWTAVAPLPTRAGPAATPSPAFSRSGPRPAATVVADRLTQFARKRHAVARQLAERRGVAMPHEVEEFFEAVERGDWPRTQVLYEALHARHQSGSEDRSPGLEAVWHAVHETLGAAEVAANWPAQALIDYGQAVLNAVPPGAVYLGGTDAGRFAPSLFNDVGGVEGRILITQNALADQSYLEYVNVLHGTRIEALSTADSEAAFSRYVEDAGRRARHDAQHPDEPVQVRPGEVIDLQADGRVQVSGQVAVMAINEALVGALLARNPTLPFALEESMPLKGLLPEALPSGPILELRAGGGDPALVRERAEASLELWRSVAGQFRSDASLPADSPVRNAWADMAAAQGSYLAAHDMPVQAEAVWRQALEIGPGNQTAMFQLVDQLVRTERRDDALQVVDRFLAANPSPPESAAALRRHLLEGQRGQVGTDVSPR